MEISDTTRQVIAIFNELDDLGQRRVMTYIEQMTQMNEMEKRLNEFEARLKKVELRDTLEQQIAVLLENNRH